MDLLGEQRLELRNTVDEALALEDVEVRKPGGAGGCVARIGVAVPEPHAFAAPERLLHPRTDDHAAERHVSRRDALREDQEVGREAVSLAAEPPAEAAEPGDHLAGADDRLADEGRDAFAAEPVDRGGELVDGVRVDVNNVRDERSETLDVRRNAAEAGSPGMHAVVGVAAADQRQLLRPADRVPVAARELRGGVDPRRSAGGGEK